MESVIKSFAKNIAIEISNRSIMDLDDIANMLEIRLKSSMIDFINEYSAKEELEYLKLLKEQSKNKIGSSNYIKLGYKLSEAKAKKSAANRASHNIKRQDHYEKLKIWVIENYGKEVFDNYITNQIKNKPIYSTK